MLALNRCRLPAPPAAHRTITRRRNQEDAVTTVDTEVTALPAHRLNPGLERARGRRSHDYDAMAGRNPSRPGKTATPVRATT
jgi:hypothetical protein